ncbi:hypothetical protein M2G61_21425 [Vibrio vulnificus]|nr:hypothetical protein [Vibrio vulnificus]
MKVACGNLVYAALTP